MSETPVPYDVTRSIEQYVEDELRNAEKFTNRTPLDESGIYSLHLLASRIYAQGFEAGVGAESVRGQGRNLRRQGGQS